MYTKPSAQTAVSAAGYEDVKQEGQIVALAESVDRIADGTDRIAELEFADGTAEVSVEAATVVELAVAESTDGVFVVVDDVVLLVAAGSFERH